MSAVSCLLSEDQFLCSICLDVFTDPVSIPCGHNFCKSCITKHWELGLACMCPNCKKVFSTRPELHVNTFISEMAAQFNQSAQQTASSSSSCSCSSSGQQAAKPGEVPCDVCTGTKVKALKSCLACLVSYCETHLEPHLKLSGLEKHQLINPVKNLEGRMCTKHDKLLELFCSKDQACICMLCTLLDHKGHEVVPLKEEFERKLMKTEADLQMMIEVRRVKIQQIKRSVEVSRRIADQEIAGSIQVFTMMKEAIEKKQAEVIRMIQESHKRKKSCVDDFIMGLNVEISNMKRRSAELEQLSKSDDHLNLLQNFPSVEAFKNCKWVIVLPPSYELSVRTAVTQLMEKLNKETEKLFPREDGTRTLLSHKQGCRQDIISS